MKVIGLKIEPVNFISLVNCNITKVVNDHITSTVAGYVTDEECENAMNADNLVIYGILEDDTSVLLFQGLPLSNEIDYSCNTRLLRINAISATVCLDSRLQYRAFQDYRQTYRDVIEEIIKQELHTRVIYTTGKEDETGRILVQYKESNWNFFKRLAGELGTIIVADCNNRYPCFYFGMPYRTKAKDVSFTNIYIHQLWDEKLVVKYECTLLSREYLELCDIVCVKSQNWRVSEINMVMEKGEVLFKYKLEPEKYKRVPSDKQNMNIKGVSILGTVKRVENAKVKVNLQGTINQDFGAGIWFEYSSIYSSPKGTGWYCMPEIGDQVRLYFPDEYESHAYVISGVHKENEDRTNPDIKSFKTRYNKEIRFTQNEIILTNNNGMSISLNDEKGVNIKSNKGISIHSDTLVDIRSSGKLSIQSKEAVSLQQNRNILLIKDGIHEKGRNIDHI